MIILGLSKKNMKKKKIGLFILLFIIMSGIVFGFIDYQRVKENKLPNFMVSIYNSRTKKQSYIGIGYMMQRTVTDVSMEAPASSSNLKFGPWFLLSNLEISYINNALDNKYMIETVEIKECNHNAKLYYANKNSNIYLYCLSSITLNNETNIVDFKDYLKENTGSFDDIIAKLVEEENIKNDGTTIYRDSDKKYTNNGLTIIKCNTIDGNKDIYLGPKSMIYEDSFCKFNEQNYFVRTYQVLQIDDSKDSDYLYVTLKMFQDEEAIVKIPKNQNFNLEINNNYEFTFEYTDKKVEDNINSIFENTKIIEIKKTDKTGLDQIQDVLRD